MRIACLLADDFEDSEFKKPYDALRTAGHEVVVIGVKEGEIKGKKGEVTTRADTTIDRVTPEEFEALLIPGGGSPDHLRADSRVVEFVRGMDSRDRPIFAVCHGPQLLIAADAIRGRRLTAWPTVQSDLRHMHENVTDEEVVIDGRLVTSRKPEDLEAFSSAAISMLQEQPAGARR